MQQPLLLLRTVMKTAQKGSAKLVMSNKLAAFAKVMVLPQTTGLGIAIDNKTQVATCLWLL